MSNEIVKYHNDLNKIKLPSFTEQEQNLLCGIFIKMRNSNNNVVKFSTDQLKKYCTKNYTEKEFGEVLAILRDKFFKADFTILIEDKERNLIGTEIINLFSSFKIWCYKHDDGYEEPVYIEMLANPRFSYILNELEKNFTGFELDEFVSLSGKYTKTLYRLLKQYRQTGFLYMAWDEFIRVMDIPENYRQIDIDTRILKPAIKELTRERTLWDITRIPFENLKYEKIKSSGRGRGRGSKVTGITFTFKPQSQEPKPKKEKISIEEHERRENMKQQFKMNQLNQYVGRHFKNKENHICKIIHISELEDKRIAMSYKDMDTDSLPQGHIFDHESHLQQWLEKWKVEASQSKLTP